MADYGLVQTRVTTSRAFYPLADVSVVLSTKTDLGQKELLASQRTNRNGLTEPVPVSTPSISQSQEPGKLRPYSFVEISVEAPGFDPAIIRNVQVFPGTITLQDIWLVPRDEFSSRPQETRDVTVTPQNL